MSPKRTHRERRNQLSDDTLVKSKGITTRTDVNSSGRKNLRKRKRNVDFKDREEPAQQQKNLTTKLKIVPTDDNSTTNIKKMNLHRSIDDSCYLDSGSKNTKGSDEVANSSSANLYSNKASKKLKSLKQWPGKTRMSTYSLKSLGGSSPIVKNLTPYRSNKTPKKSPRRMSPVKAHSVRPSRVFGTSKRLTLTVNSLSEFQGDERLPNDNNMQMKLHVSDADLSTSCNLSKRRTPTFTLKKGSKSTSMPSIGVKYGTRRFSKSAKTALRSTNLKLRSKSSKASTIRYFHYENTKLKEPIVLLQRLPNIVRIVPSSSPLSSSMVKICINDRFSDNNINVPRKIFESAFNRSEELLEKSIDKRRTRTGSCSNDEQKKRLGTMLCKVQEPTKTHLHEKSLCDKMTTKCDNANEIFSDSFISSTPKDKETLDKSVGKCKRRKMSPQCSTTFELIKHNTRSNQNNVTVTIENEQEEIKRKNETYELIEPKTPNLRKQLQEERDVQENNLTEKPSEKNVKVRLTSSDTNSNSNIRYCGRLNENNKLDDFESIVFKASLKKNILKSTIGASHRRSSHGKRTRVVDSIIPSQIASKSVTSFVRAKTPATSSFIPRKNTKSSATKGVPNFAEIHKKMFAKLESIVDVKNRVRNRHAAFATPRIDDSAKRKVNSNEGGDQLSKELNRETYNRFGFKMRKREATDCILRNDSLRSARRKQQDRAILKGVRTNRRFELQMKLRNLNI